MYIRALVRSKCRVIWIVLYEINFKRSGGVGAGENINLAIKLNFQKAMLVQLIKLKNESCIVLAEIKPCTVRGITKVKKLLVLGVLAVE